MQICSCDLSPRNGNASLFNSFSSTNVKKLLKICITSEREHSSVSLCNFCEVNQCFGHLFQIEGSEKGKIQSKIILLLVLPKY